FSLAVTLWEQGRWQEAVPFVQHTLMRYPRANIKPGLREQIGEWIAGILEESVEVAVDTVALQLAFESGEVGGDPVVTLSDVELRRIRRWDRLAKLLGSGKVIAAQLTPEVPDRSEGPTILERLLGGAPPPRRGRRWSSRSRGAKRPGAF